MLHTNIAKLMEGFRHDAHPMGMFISTMGALSTFYPDAKNIFSEESRRLQTVRLIAKVPSISAYAFRHSIGRPFNQPDNELSYAGNFLNMLFRMTELKYNAHPVLERALDVLFILHADHEQNCSTSVMRGDRQLARRSRTRPSPARRQRSTVPCMAAPMRRCCACSTRSDRYRTCRASSSGSRPARAG